MTPRAANTTCLWLLVALFAVVAVLALTSGCVKGATLNRPIGPNGPPIIHVPDDEPYPAYPLDNPRPVTPPNDPWTIGPQPHPNPLMPDPNPYHGPDR